MPVPPLPKIEPPLVDRFGRVHTKLRVSVTDRCNLRCRYCMPAEGVPLAPRDELLTFEEIERAVCVATRLGVTRVRLTGGEPLVRKGLEDLVARLLPLPGLDEVALTTNGVLLVEQAERLHRAGLRRLNISLDALQAEAFERITRRDDFDRVIAGLNTAREVGLGPIKINAISMRGVTEDQVALFGRFARETGLEVRFIEYMPLDASREWERDKVLFAEEVRELLTEQVQPLVPIGTSDQGPASVYQFADGVGRIGFIPSVSEPFCAACDRFRLTSDGKLRSCLFSLDEVDLRGPLRAGAHDAEIAEVIRACLRGKWAGHQINTELFRQPQRGMSAIGG